MDYLERWDRLSVSEKAKKLARALPGKTWTDLRARMLTTPTSAMTPIQRDAIPDLLKY